jgi:hypothetical protein
VYVLYEKALLELNRYDLLLNIGAGERGGMADDNAVAAVWRGYLRLNPAEKAD